MRGNSRNVNVGSCRNFPQASGTKALVQGEVG